MARKKAAPVNDDAPGTVGALLRDIRKRREMTLEQLSERTGISVSSLSRIENTQLGLTIEKVEILADALGVAPEDLVARNRDGAAARRPVKARPRRDRFAIDRARDRVASHDRELSLEYLFGRNRDRSLECLHLRLRSISVWDTEFVRHPGEKIIYVMSGELVVYCEKRPPVILEAGDSLYMDAYVWHSVVALNGRPAELLVSYYHEPEARGSPFETQIFTPESWAALQAD